MSSSVPHAQKRKGNMNNRDLTRDFITDSVAASTKIPAGVCTYVDAALGRKVTDGAKAFGAVRFTEYEADNSNSTVLGTVKATTFKGGAIVVLEAGGAINVGDPVESAAGGDVVASTTPANYIGVYLGHPNETGEVEVDPTAAVDEELVVVRSIN